MPNRITPSEEEYFSGSSQNIEGLPCEIKSCKMYGLVPYKKKWYCWDHYESLAESSHDWTLEDVPVIEPPILRVKKGGPSYRYSWDLDIRRLQGFICEGVKTSGRPCDAQAVVKVTTYANRFIEDRWGCSRHLRQVAPYCWKRIRKQLGAT